MKIRTKRRCSAVFYCVAVTIALSLLTTPCLAIPTWQQDGKCICDQTNRTAMQSDDVAADGQGGVYFSTGGSYLQRIDRNGDVRPGWSDDGVLVATTGYAGEIEQTVQFNGDAIVVWDVGAPHGGIRAQRIGASGARMWGNGGVLLSPEPEQDPVCPRVATFNDRIAIAWFEFPTGGVRLQFLDGEGRPQLREGGILTGPPGRLRGELGMIALANSTVLMAWSEYGSNLLDIRAQMVAMDGQLLCSENGISVCDAREQQFELQIVNDSVLDSGDGWSGATIVWQDSRNGNYDIYAQRVGVRDFDEGGRTLWRDDGVSVCSTSADDSDPRAMVNKSGPAGTVVTWEREHNEPNQPYDTTDVYAQRLDIHGNRMWSSGGVGICTLAGFQQSQEIVSADGEGGAIVTWVDSGTDGAHGHIYATRIDAHGNKVWYSSGSSGSSVPICTAPGSQNGPVIVATEEGAQVIAWLDYRDPRKRAIFAQRIYEPPPPVLDSVDPNSGNNWGGELELVLSGEHLGNVDAVTLETYASSAASSGAGTKASFPKPRLVYCPRVTLNATDVHVVSENQVTCRVDLTGAEPWVYHVVAKSTAWRQMSRLRSAFQVRGGMVIPQGTTPIAPQLTPVSAPAGPR